MINAKEARLRAYKANCKIIDMIEDSILSSVKAGEYKLCLSCFFFGSWKSLKNPSLKEKIQKYFEALGYQVEFNTDSNNEDEVTISW